MICLGLQNILSKKCDIYKCVCDLFLQKDIFRIEDVPNTKDTATEREVPDLCAQQDLYQQRGSEEVGLRCFRVQPVRTLQGRLSLRE